MSKKPGRGSDQFPLRLPDGLRDRIKATAESNGRSMNAEIVKTLEDAYPIPFTLDDAVQDIQETLKILKRFKGTSMVMVLADSLDNFLLDLARSKEGTPEDRDAAHQHAYEHGKRRFNTPDID